jgi:hypothetical protein
VGGDAGIAGQDKFCAAVDDLGQLREVDAMRRYGPDRDVVRHICAEGLQGLDQQSSGGLAVHIEVSPDANSICFAYSQQYRFHGPLHPWELERRSQGLGVGVEKGARSFEAGDASPDESICDEWGQVQACAEPPRSVSKGF